MHLNSYRLKNYRRLREVRVEFAEDISIFVGSNNSGKTSATQAIQLFLSADKRRFSLYDFSSHLWQVLNKIGETDATNDESATIPSITLDLWFEVSAADLYLVIPILPSSEWEGTLVGLRIEFGARSGPELRARFREKRLSGEAKADALQDGRGNYVPWPKNLTDYLQKELQNEFEFRYFVLDRARFNDDFEEFDGYTPSLLGGDLSGSAVLESLIRVDYLPAQRHLTDPAASASGMGGRAEDLSRRLSRFYQRNLEQREEDHRALKALFDSEVGLNAHLADVFAPTLKRLATLGYPGLNNPRLEIKSAINPATVMSQDARVHYIVGDSDSDVVLPDSYNGLGFKNLIYMVVEILDVQAKWADEKENRAPLHLIFIEEPEVHLHAQLQQVFVRNILGLLEIEGEARGAFSNQVVITTHSPHILYERGFTPIRYFRRHFTNGEQTTKVLNLSSFQRGPTPKDKDFLQRYLKLMHCDLFFSDAAILVEGNVERLLMPVMIEKEAKALRSASLCILEVGGAFGHRFKALIEFLGLPTLIITDIDSVSPKSASDPDDEDDDKEFEVPAEGEGAEPERFFGRTCLPSLPGAVTANQTLIQWLPRKRTIVELMAASDSDKVEKLPEFDSTFVRVAYQVPSDVTWNGVTSSLCGRTLEEAFGLENALWCQLAERRQIGLKLRAEPADPIALAEALHKRITGKSFDKTKFALSVLAETDGDWQVPRYISDGLTWLNSQIRLELEKESAAIIESVNAGAEAGLDVEAPEAP
jgi:hypothetical protein